MLTFYIILIGLYIFILGKLASKWPTTRPESQIIGQEVGQTVIVPFRDELPNLPELINSLVENQPSEVLFVNDVSMDGGGSFLKKEIDKRNLSNWRIIDSGGVGKKAAVSYGVSLAVNDIILVTDADCQVPSGWAENMTKLFQNPKVQMVCGPVLPKKWGGWLGKFELGEWCSILLVTNFGFAENKPFMCSAANMGYRKGVFEEVGGYEGNENLFSGDDEFLLKKVANRFGPHAVVWNRDVELLVKTNPATNLDSLLDQRARWASKWGIQKAWQEKLPPLIMVFFSMMFMFSFILLLPTQHNSRYFFVIWMLKGLADCYYLGRVLDHYLPDLPKTTLLIASAFHPVYTLLIVWKVLFTTIYWKGRDIFTHVKDEKQHV